MTAQKRKRGASWLLYFLSLCLAIIGLSITAQPAVAAETADWLPLKGIYSNAISCTWSNGCSGGYHGASSPAIDFAVPYGTAVYAAGSGTVTASNNTCDPNNSWGCSGGRGRFVEITHPDGRHSRYLHLSNVDKTSGDVAGGDLIGHVGNSGNSDEAHLHYDELVDGVKVDPGVMNAIHGSSLVQYPNTLGYTSWSAVPAFGSNQLRNDSFSAATGVGTRLLGDVNGDSKDDAVIMFRDTGTAMVALSTGNSFAAPTSWSYLHTVGADRYFLADVNGDSMADLVSFWVSNGRWRVSLSSGLGFWPETEWAYGQGTGTTKQWVVDVDGDPQHRADTVTFDSTTGDWYVSTSTGTGFGPTQQQWADGHGYGSNDQVVADFSGDGKADAGVYFASTGAWHIAKSLGTTFGGAPPWSNGHGMNSNLRHVGDVNGDNKADTAYFFSSNGHWDVGISSGSGIWAPTAWADGHGEGTTEQFLAKVNSDSMADIVTFDRSTGDWWVSASSGSGFWPPARWISGHGQNS